MGKDLNRKDGQVRNDTCTDRLLQDEKGVLTFCKNVEAIEADMPAPTTKKPSRCRGALKKRRPLSRAGDEVPFSAKKSRHLARLIKQSNAGPPWAEPDRSRPRWRFAVREFVDGVDPSHGVEVDLPPRGTTRTKVPCD